MNKEKWRLIFDDYYISNLGRVYSLKTNKMLTAIDNGKGYLSVPIRLNGKQKRCYVHRLVAKAFIPNPDNLPQVNHIDGNKSNNNVNNLEWVTRKENTQHALKNGLIPTALNEKQRKEVRELYYNSKLSTDEIGKIFNVSSSCIQKNVKDIKPKYNRSGRNKFGKKITDSEKEEIKKKYLTGEYSISSLAREFKIGKTSVYRIVKELPSRQITALSKDEQIKVFELYKTGEYSQSEIAKMFDTSQPNICHYIHKLRGKEIVEVVNE